MAGPETGAPPDLVYIHGGAFTMGSPLSEVSRRDNETQRRVTVGPFYLGKYEVTQEEYEAVMGTNPSYFKGKRLPVERTSWYDAVEYCNRRSEREGLTPAYTIDKTREDPSNTNPFDPLRWLVVWNRDADGYRLPTEAEWEYACRAGTATPFNTGDNITTESANYDGNFPYNNKPRGLYREHTTETGSFPPNPWGLYDMHGNVMEWCWDWYGSYDPEARTAPPGAASGASRIRRGGSWVSDARHVRSAYRPSVVPSYRDNYLGFRLARSSPFGDFFARLR
jgi:formylglycine-generating enzyme required for sulfatase activity